MSKSWRLLKNLVTMCFTISCEEIPSYQCDFWVIAYAHMAQIKGGQYLSCVLTVNWYDYMIHVLLFKASLLCCLYKYIWLIVFVFGNLAIEYLILFSNFWMPSEPTLLFFQSIQTKTLTENQNDSSKMEPFVSSRNSHDFLDIFWWLNFTDFPIYI